MKIPFIAVAKRLVVFIQTNALVCLFFGLILLGASQIAVGLLWKAFDDDNNYRVKRTIDTFELEKKKLQSDYEKASSVYERFREDYSSKLRLAREELEQKITRFQMEQQRDVDSQNTRIQSQLREMKSSYEVAVKDLNEQKDQVKLRLMEAKIEHERKLDEAARKWEQDLKKAAMALEGEAVRVGYVRSELEVLLDEIQKDLHEVELASQKTSFWRKRAPGLEKLVSARIKLTVFLAEYRNRMKIEIPQIKRPDLVDIAPPTVITQDLNSLLTKLNAQAIQPLELQKADMAKLVDLDKLDAIKPVVLTNSMTLLAAKEIVPSFMELLATGKLWLLPILFGVACFALAGFLGVDLVRKTQPTKAA